MTAAGGSGVAEPTDGLARGSHPAALDPRVDRLFVDALQASDVKLMFETADGEHREAPLPRGAVGPSPTGTRCYMNLEAAAPTLRDLLKPPELPPDAVDRVNAYVSPPGGGTPLHFDIRTVWIVQLFGEKTWFVSRDPAVADPPRNFVAPLHAEGFEYEGRPLSPPETLIANVLRPGDWLRVRRGVWHRTFTPAGSVSASLAAPEGWTD